MKINKGELFAMTCPKCDSNRFDGEHCSNCGYMYYEPIIKQIYEATCDLCGKPIQINMFFGAECGSHIGKENYRYCIECRHEYIKKYNDNYGLLNRQVKASKKRLDQIRNLEKWGNGEKVA